MSTHPILVMALTIFLEARGEGETGMRMVASVIYNRSVKRGLKPHEVCLEPKQFSCWNEMSNLRDIGQTISTDYEQWKKCLMIAAELNNDVFTALSGADHYHSINADPSWSHSMTPLGKIGNHIFYLST